MQLCGGMQIFVKTLTVWRAPCILPKNHTDRAGERPSRARAGAPRAAQPSNTQADAHSHNNNSIPLPAAARAMHCLSFQKIGHVLCDDDPE